MVFNRILDALLGTQILSVSTTTPDRVRKFDVGGCGHYKCQMKEYRVNGQLHNELNKPAVIREEYKDGKIITTYEWWYRGIFHRREVVEDGNDDEETQHSPDGSPDV